jgi:hypothetical protein
MGGNNKRSAGKAHIPLHYPYPDPGMEAWNDGLSSNEELADVSPLPLPNWLAGAKVQNWWFPLDANSIDHRFSNYSHGY